MGLKWFITQINLKWYKRSNKYIIKQSTHSSLIYLRCIFKFSKFPNNPPHDFFNPTPQPLFLNNFVKVQILGCGLLIFHSISLTTFSLKHLVIRWGLIYVRSSKNNQSSKISKYQAHNQEFQQAGAQPLKYEQWIS